MQMCAAWRFTLTRASDASESAPGHQRWRVGLGVSETLRVCAASCLLHEFCCCTENGAMVVYIDTNRAVST